MDQLQSVWSDRTHIIKRRKISFAVCGEIDAFKKDGEVKANRKLPYDILINPTHTIRGRWQHLGPKLKKLSLGAAVIHVANNDYDRHDVTTHLRIYVNGEIMQRHVSGGISWSECKL